MQHWLDKLTNLNSFRHVKRITGCACLHATRSKLDHSSGVNVVPLTVLLRAA